MRGSIIWWLDYNHVIYCTLNTVQLSKLTDFRVAFCYVEWRVYFHCNISDVWRRCLGVAELPLWNWCRYIFSKEGNNNFVVKFNLKPVKQNWELSVYVFHLMQWSVIFRRKMPHNTSSIVAVEMCFIFFISFSLSSLSLKRGSTTKIRWA